MKDFVYFRNSANNLLYEVFKHLSLRRNVLYQISSKSDKVDIKSLDCNKIHYFSFSELNSDDILSYVPDLLQIFLKSLVPARNTINGIHYAGIA